MPDIQMKRLPISWQRLVSGRGTTCPRCQGTSEEVQRAVRKLQQALEPLGIAPELQTQEIDEAAFLQDPLQSNQILIAGQPIEYWLGGQTGRSRCCDECGDNDCRTVEVGGQRYEVIPEDLLVRAGMIAASRMLDPSLSS
ncbi:DUF2703 domain-containing protein [uncultured Aquimonas sp.]|uniref:DUF2703 domain-containing protein n=1 Tax=uncultured Aquimonas sp. TaxID=385483 RepID=UPI0026041E70|nr:DUF2703 domain-containing protein [uncultured Aquimonas sp.]